MSDSDYIKAALKELGDKATLDLVQKWVSAKKALDQLAAGEETEPEEPPVEEAEMSKAKSVKASDDPKPEETKAPEVKPEVKLADPAEMEMAMAALAQVAEAAGMDLATLIAAIQQDPAKFAAALGAAPEEAEASLSADERAVAASRVQAVQAKLSAAEGREKKLQERLEELEVKERTQRIDAAIAAGHLLDKDRDRAVSLAKKAPEVLEQWLTEGQKQPAVPKGKLVAGKQRDSGLNVPTGDDPRIQKYVKAGMSIELAQRRVSNPDEPYTEAVKAVRKQQSTGAA